MNFEQAISLINTYRGKGKKDTLDRVQLLMDKIGNPEAKLKAVHVAGTNGKGTTCAFLSSVLIEAGLNVGLYTSPHLETIHERVKINDTMISTDDLIHYTELVAPFVEEVEEERKETLYSFEILTAVAFLYFVEKGIDILVLETGMGGNYDATNTIKEPIVSIITSIGYDHMYILGDTVEEIASQKAGIIKENRPAVIYPMEKSVIAVVKEKAEAVNASLTVLSYEDVDLKYQTIDQQIFDFKDFADVSMGMIGEHQLYNCALAIEGLKEVQKAGFNVSDEQIYRGIQTASWMGRMEKVSDQPVVFLDGAHNVQGVSALNKNITQLFPDEKITFFIGIMKDKEFMTMMNLIGHKAEKMYILSPNEGKGFDPYQVSKDLQKEGYPARALDSVDEIVDYIQNKAGKEEKIMIFGSLYLVGDVRKALFS